jgi:hypothetical protein
MTGVFVFPTETDNKAYKFKKNPKDVLKLSNEEMVRFARETPKLSYFIHYTPETDELSDSEKIAATKKFHDRDYSKLKKIKGKDHAYVTEDDKHIVKVITADRDWFDKHYGK